MADTTSLISANNNQISPKQNKELQKLHKSFQKQNKLIYNCSFSVQSVT